MERGLLWLPLLFAFFWLAWQGYQEYQKVETYRLWSEQFERAKYDIYAIIGQKGNDITWGKPSPQGPVKLETFSLLNVQEIRLLVNKNCVNMETPPAKGREIELEFLFTNNQSVKIPFTETSLASKWGKCLQGMLNI